MAEGQMFAAQVLVLFQLAVAAAAGWAAVRLVGQLRKGAPRA